nr:hypothetical protein [uncultured Mucilaginibacter sp.]
MRRIFITCLCVLYSTAQLYAQTTPKKLQVSLGTGYQREGLKWSIAGNLQGQSPNIYSELQWKKVGGQSVAASLQWNFWNKLMLMGDYRRVSIKSGTVRDNDYNGDNRTSPAYDQLFDADKGFTREIAIGLGYKLIDNENFSLTPYAGYSANKQSLHLFDGSGQYANLNSTYDTDWQGAFVKAIAGFKLSKKLSATGTLTYNQAGYKAKADWNLIPTFRHPVSYLHTAKGYGVDATAALQYAITKNIAINLGGGFFTWQTGEGIDELFLASGGSEKTQLNEVDRKGHRFFGGLIFSW